VGSGTIQAVSAAFILHTYTVSIVCVLTQPCTVTSPTSGQRSWMLVRLPEHLEQLLSLKALRRNPFYLSRLCSYTRMLDHLTRTTLNTWASMLENAWIVGTTRHAYILQMLVSHEQGGLRPFFALVIQGSATVGPDTFILFHTLVWLVAWQRLSV
jgi:hypothetical protein